MTDTEHAAPQSAEAPQSARNEQAAASQRPAGGPSPHPELPAGAMIIDEVRWTRNAPAQKSVAASHLPKPPASRNRPKAPVATRPLRPFSDFSSHDSWGTDHFGFMYQGDLEAFCRELGGKGVSFPVPLKRGVGGSLLCYVAAPDGVSIELMQC